MGKCSRFLNYYACVGIFLWFLRSVYPTHRNFWENSEENFWNFLQGWLFISLSIIVASIAVHLVSSNKFVDSKSRKCKPDYYLLIAIFLRQSKSTSKMDSRLKRGVFILCGLADDISTRLSTQLTEKRSYFPFVSFSRQLTTVTKNFRRLVIVCSWWAGASSPFSWGTRFRDAYWPSWMSDSTIRVLILSTLWKSLSRKRLTQLARYATASCQEW